MLTLESATQMQRLRSDWSREAQTVGFVPTMGALHDGHLSLVRQAQNDNQRVVVSLFVNPTQFNDPKDFALYPTPLAEDLAMLTSANVDAVFLPQAQEIYADAYQFELREKSTAEILCGAYRPGHFTGVLTVVLKLLNIVSPTRAYFGEKDYQQLYLIQDMARALFLNTEVIGCPTLREADGLAMSSRNRRLTPEQRRLAPELYRHLSDRANSPTVIQRELEALGFRVEYVEDHWNRRFIAAYLGDVRLIDNV